MTQQEYEAGALTVATALGDIPADSTPADAQAVIDQLADQQVLDNSVRLLRALGWEQPAAA
ncbi:hypothetical protein [Kitasatospora sp. NPDC057223]|uniref:hypothetical protein n=1 Tax=Kitasatospora sp. NPDC057223 TaxID=3346055 RepID=UPI003645C804